MDDEPKSPAELKEIRLNRKLAQDAEGIKAMADIAAADIAIRKRTENLRAIRLAKEAADRDKPPEPKAKTKPKKKKKAKPPEVKASVVLEWTPPHRASEVVPSRCLSPVSFAESLEPLTTGGVTWSYQPSESS